MLKFSEGITSAAEKCGAGEEGKKRKKEKEKGFWVLD